MTLTGTFTIDGRQVAGSFEPDAASVEVLARQVAGVSKPMSRVEFAKHVGKSMATIERWLAQGMPRTKRGGVVLIDAESAMLWLKGAA